MSPEVHTRKRQYQPSRQATLNPVLGRGTNVRSPLSPPLDDATQSSLLSVGMRVRKSVPEGYKTHKTLGSPGFPFPASAPIASHSSVVPARPSMHTASSRELTPFCGLHKTGGLAQQAPVSSAPAAMQRRGSYDQEEAPALFMSQRTATSRQNSFADRSGEAVSNKKRAYEDEADEEMDAFFDEGDFADAVDDVEPDVIRRIARMKSAPRKSLSGAVHIVDPDEFEEAPFLVPMEEE